MGLQPLLMGRMSFGLRAVSNSVCNAAAKNSASLRAPITTAVAHRAKHGGSEGSNGSGGQGSVHALALAAGLALAAAKAYSERERFSLKAETSEVKVKCRSIHG